MTTIKDLDGVIGNLNVEKIIERELQEQVRDSVFKFIKKYNKENLTPLNNYQALENATRETVAGLLVDSIEKYDINAWLDQVVNDVDFKIILANKMIEKLIENGDAQW